MHQRHRQRHHKGNRQRDQRPPGTDERGGQCQAREDGSERPQNDHGSPGAVAHLQQSVMEMLSIRNGHPRSTPRTAEDGQHRVEHRHGKDHERDEQRRHKEVCLTAEPRCRVRSAAHHHGGSSQEQAQQQCACVSHEDARRRKVPRKKADTRATRDDGDERTHVVSGKQTSLEQPIGIYEEHAATDGHDPGRQAVQAIDEVDGVGHTQHPENSEQRHQIGRQHQYPQERYAHVVHHHAKEIQGGAGQDHPRQLRRWGHVNHVVHHTHGGDNHCRQGNTERLR